MRSAGVVVFALLSYNNKRLPRFVGGFVFSTIRSGTTGFTFPC